MIINLLMSQNEVLTFFSTVATLFAIIMAVLAYFNWSNIRQNVKHEVRRYTKEYTDPEIKRVKENLYAANSIYTEYLLLIQNSDVDTYMPKAEELVEKSAKLNLVLWNVWLHGAIKSLVLPLAWLGCDHKLGLNDLQRTYIDKALNLLNRARESSQYHELSEVDLWTAVAFALLNNPDAALHFLQNIKKSLVLKDAYQWLDVFWNMWSSPDDGPLSSVALVFGIDPLLTCESWGLLFGSNNKIIEEGGVWLLGAERATGCASAIKVSNNWNPNASETLVIQYRHFKKTPEWDLHPSMTAEKVEKYVQSPNDAATFLMKEYACIIKAPPVLSGRWIHEHIESENNMLRMLSPML